MANMVPSVPTPNQTLPSLQEGVLALKQNVEILTGTHKNFHTPAAPKTAAAIAVDAAIAAVVRMNA
jgi:hypothetical protein